MDGIGPIKNGVAGVRRAAAVTSVTEVRNSAIRHAAAANVVPNPAADLAAYGPPVDEARIEALRSAIAAGTYRADPEQIAAKMIETDLPAPAASPTPAPAPAPAPAGKAAKA